MVLYFVQARLFRGKQAMTMAQAFETAATRRGPARRGLVAH